MSDRLDAVHDRANRMERAARMLNAALLELINYAAAPQVPPPVRQKAERAVEFAAGVGVS